ncbi:hypothetical protein HZC09_04605 [Candidatus Micrarchaeota archaeon]|nr:hypothetical protein [Candidatus Micrarchaeota archaeon]
MSFRKGQISLWMLTKFSMVFFIIMLSVVMLGFTEKERENVCSTQANKVAKAIASSINAVINSPSEDERKVIALQSSLSYGKREFERYVVELENIPSDEKPFSGSITVRVRPSVVTPQMKGMCEGGARASYDSATRIDPIMLKPNSPMVLQPSDVQQRDYYIVLIKCSPKVPHSPSGTYSKNYLFVERCSAKLGEEPDPNKCLPLAKVDKCCGWTGGAPVCG